MKDCRVRFWVLALGAIAGCTGSIGGSGDEPPPDLTPPELGPADPDLFFAGQALYDVSCSACHGVFEESEKRGVSAARIDEALATVEPMRAFEARLSEEDRELIAYALAYDPASVECPPLDTPFTPAPRPRAILAAELSSRLGLERSDVDEALSGYLLGYDSSEDFDNQLRDQAIVVDTTETLLAAMEEIAGLWLEDTAFGACADAVCAGTALTELTESLGLEGAVLTSAREIYDDAVDLGLAVEGVRIAATRVLMSPQFVFDTQIESSSPQTRLVAALAQRSPSPEELGTPTESLLNSLLPEAGEMLAARFTLRWLGIAQTGESLAAVDPALLPVDPALIADLERETSLHFQAWLEGDEPLRNLLSSEESFVNERIAAYYGLSGVSGEEFRRTPMGARGGGLLTQGAVLISSGGSSSTSPVTRGKWVLDHLLCTNLPPLPADDVIAEVQSEIDSGAEGPRTEREHSAARREVSQCGGCHTVIDEIGFGLEGFDSWGAAREVYDDGHVVETAGVLPGDNEFEDHQEMASILRESTAFRMCASRKLTQYLMGRPLGPAESCHIRRLVSDLDPETGAQEWIRRIVLSEAFLQEARR